MNDTRLSDAAVTGVATVKTPKTLDEMLATAQRPTELVPVCLRADVLAEIQKRELMIREAETDETDSRLAGSGSGPSPADLAQEIRELEQVAADNTYYFTLQAVDSDRWKAGIAAHTKDDGSQDIDAALKSMLFESIAAPAVTQASVTKMLGFLSDGQWAKLGNKLLELNRNVVDVPKSLTAYMTLRESPGKRESGEK